MTPSTDQQEKVEVKSLGQKLHEACCPIVSVWSKLPADTRSVYEANALRFAASLTHDETASALLAAEREENERLRMEIMGGEDVPGLAASLPLQTILDIQADNVAVSRSSFERLLTAQAQITAQSETIKSLSEALHEVKSADVSGEPGMWVHVPPETALRRIKDIVQATLSKALPDTGEQSQ